MHLAVEPDPFEHAAAVRLHRAAEVVQRHAGDPRDKAVGDPRRDLAGQERVLAVAPPAGDDVEALVDPVEEPGDVGGVVLAVAVHRHEDRAAREVERGRERGGLAAVAPEEGDEDVVGVGVLDRGELRRRAVGRAVVDEDQLVTQRRPAEHAVKLVVQRGDVVDLVVDGDQDREVDSGGGRDVGRGVGGGRGLHGTSSFSR